MYTLSPTGLALQPIKWQNKVVAIQTNVTSLSSSTGSLKYKYAIQRDAKFTRYTAFYVQIAFNMNSSPLTSQVSESQLFTVSTETNIIPEFNPVGDCHGSDCLGYLV
jgi:dimeric dUTPase (all-alpha-NTP-PPase superfamily)